MNRIKVMGNRHIIGPLSAAADSGRLASAYLLEGPSGSGKRTLASFLCALLVCSQKQGDTPCFTCRDCENVLVGSHPDVFVFAPEKDRDSVSVDVARRANEAALTAPIHAKKRVFIIPDAARLHPAAQNALLKNLEEPRSASVYLLLCEEAAGVLATIRSRCVTYRMELFGEETVFAHLKDRFPKEDEETLRLAARLSGGALGQAEAFLSDRRMSDCREKAEEYLSLVMRGGTFADFCAVLGAETKKEFLPLFYRVLLSGVRDLICAASGAQDRRFFEPDRDLSCSVSRQKLFGLADKLCELTDPSMTNANAAASVFALNAQAAR